MPSPIVVHLVPHSHWDREWYLPFQTFRMRLVALIDGLLEAMEADPRLRFTLDGQLATVDDYLEVRPDAEPRIAALVREGRLAVGPWLILMDEFLVGGETIVRNLELGIRRASVLGRVMKVGYLPDMFGHIAQMPQILRGVGIADAVVWRGVPAAIDRHAFAWRSPDGSTVRCEYLWRGYGNARHLFDDPDRVGARLTDFATEVASLFGPDDVLAMYGEDHSFPLLGFPDLVDRFNRDQGGYRIEIDTLADYVAVTRPADGATVAGQAPQAWDGELRSSSRANILMGVVSNRVDVRAASAAAERSLWRVAEPIVALHGDAWPERYLDLAARRLVENSAHDSICACSIDPVVNQVLVRFAEAHQIAGGLAAGVLGRWAGSIPGGAWLAFNPSPVDREGLIEILLPDDDAGGLVDVAGAPVEIQELGRDQRTFDDRTIPAEEVETYFLRRIHGRELFNRQINGWTIDGSGRDLTVHVDDVADPPVFDVGAMVTAIARAVSSDAATAWRVRVVGRARRSVLTRVRVPGLGLTSIGAADRSRRARRNAPSSGPESAVRVSNGALANERLSVTVAGDGTISLTGQGTTVAGLGRLVDGGDVGDLYNYAPPPVDRIVEQPEAVAHRVLESGPLRGVIEVVRRYRWPRGLAADLGSRSGQMDDVEVTTRVELRAGEPFVSLAIAFDHRIVDHRLRLHLPVPVAAEHSWADGGFAIVQRGLSAEGGHGEHPLPTQPAEGFVTAGGLAVLARHVVEYELVDAGRELAITLLRATGIISRDGHPYRDEPAGPVLPAPGAQLQGPRTFELAVMPTEPGLPGPEVVTAAEAYRNPLVAAPGSGPVDAVLVERTGLRIEGAGVVLSSLRRRGDRLEVRLVALRPSPVVARIEGAFRSAYLADLLGRTGERLVARRGRVEVPLAPWQIATVQLDPAADARDQPPKGALRSRPGTRPGRRSPARRGGAGRP